MEDSNDMGVPGFTKAVVLNSPEDANAYLTRVRCPCGGNYSVAGRELYCTYGCTYDIAHVACTSCGEESDIYFDITRIIEQETSQRK